MATVLALLEGQGPETFETVAAAVLVVCAAAVVQSVMGFGYAVVGLPLLSILADPRTAVIIIIGSGFVVDALVLGKSRGAPRPSWREAIGLGLWSLPGLAVGALVLGRVPADTLQIVIAVAVLAAVAQQGLSMRGRSRCTRLPLSRRPAPMARAAAGLTSGALSTSTSLGGPPVVLYLRNKLSDSREMRDTMVVLSVARLPLSVGAIALAGAWSLPHMLPVYWIAAAIGFLAGRKLFELLNTVAYRRAALGVLAASAFGAVGPIL